MQALKLFPGATDGEDGHGLNKFKIAMPAKISKKNYKQLLDEVFAISGII